MLSEAAVIATSATRITAIRIAIRIVADAMTITPASATPDRGGSTETWQWAHFLPSALTVGNERRDYDRRSRAQRRVIEWLCINPVGSTPAEVAAAAEIPRSAARRILRCLAAKMLVRARGARWAAAEILLHVPRLIRESV